MANPNLVQKVLSLACKTFSRSQPLKEVIFKERLIELTDLASQLSADDLRLNSKTIEAASVRDSATAPTNYIEVYKNGDVTVGIFVIKAGCKIPLHDHPNMHGIIKVLSGTLRLESFSRLPQYSSHSGNDQSSKKIKKCIPDEFNNNNLLRMNFEKGLLKKYKKLNIEYVSSSDKAKVLTPSEGNLHEISSHDGPAAFVDILSPPYDEYEQFEHETRDCHYFKKINLTKNSINLLQSSSNTVWLQELPVAPPEFYCDILEYEGPKILLNND